MTWGRHGDLSAVSNLDQLPHAGRGCLTRRRLAPFTGAMVWQRFPTRKICTEPPRKLYDSSTGELRESSTTPLRPSVTENATAGGTRRGTKSRQVPDGG